MASKNPAAHEIDSTQITSSSSGSNLDEVQSKPFEESEDEENEDENSSESDMPESHLARMQNQASRASPKPHQYGKSKLRTLHRDREALRSGLHQRSFLALSNKVYSSGPSDDNEIAKALATASQEFDPFQIDSDRRSIEQTTLWVNLKDNHWSRTVAPQLLENLIYMIQICQNIARVIRRNISRLKNAKLLGEFMSMLILDYKRSNNEHQVAVLERIKTRDLETFVNRVSTFTEELLEETGHRNTILNKISYHIRSSLQIVRPLLFTLGFDILDDTSHIEQGSDRFEETRDRMRFLKCILEILDICLLVYEGGHCGNLDYDILKQRQEIDTEIKEPGSYSSYFSYFPTASHYPIQLCRLHLKCLSGFLGGRHVWVFKHVWAPSSKEPLYISTDIETFADVWGPVWKVTDKALPASVRRYNVGEGSIFASTFDPTIHPPLQEDERLCHWKEQHVDVHFENNSTPDDSKSLLESEFKFQYASSSDSSIGETSDKDEIPFELDLAGPELLKESDRLLIGAHSNPGFKWRKCRCETTALKQQLKEAGRLDRIIASKAYRFVESQQATLTAGSHGISAGLGITFKNKKQESLKKGLLESWENDPLLRDPREFENYWGVVVSLCTMNARRVRLSQLLGGDSVVALLKPFHWSDLSWDSDVGEYISHRRSMFLEAVYSSDPCALGNLWDANPTWQEELGKVLLMLLRILCRTGYDENRDEFHILWVPQGCRSPRRVTLKPTDQTWIKFLKDTTFSMTVAVIVEDRLGRRRCCNEADPRRFKFPSILETAICINERRVPAARLRKQIGGFDKYHWRWRESHDCWKSIWDVSNVSYDQRFKTGPQSRLKVIGRLTNWHLLLKWDPIKRDLIRGVVGIEPSERDTHWEYTDQEDADGETRPIPVHIMT